LLLLSTSNVCQRVIARVYRAVVGSATLPGLEEAADFGFGTLWFLKTQFLVFKFSVLSSQLLFAFCSPEACRPCYNALPHRSAELLGPQRRISNVVLKPGLPETPAG
jgi:hypothetical protein